MKNIFKFLPVISEIAKTSRMFTEAAGRVEPLPADVTLALIDMGLSLNGMEQYAFRPNRHAMPPPAQSTQVKQLSLLAAGSKQHLPHYIPNHLPQFPDPHAYTRTPVSNIMRQKNTKILVLYNILISMTIFNSDT